MIQADARQLPLRDDSVDLVISSPPFPGNVWERDYWNQMARAKSEMTRVLKPDKPVLLLQQMVRPGMWWFLDGEVVRKGRLLPPETFPGWQRLPEDDVEDLIHLWSDPGDLIMDPFAGSGTVERVAARLGRRGISLDLEVPRETRIFQPSA